MVLDSTKSNEIINNKFKKCEFCGKELAPEGLDYLYANISPDAIKYERCDCNKAQEYWKKIDEQEHQEEKRKHFRNIINNIYKENYVGRKFQEKNFENFNINSENEIAVEVAKDYANKSITEIQNEGLIITGKSGAESEIMELESQFRCNGSDGYIAWLDDVLDIRKTANSDGFDLDYDIKICDTPNEVRDIIFEKNKINNKARLLAGYCWDWIKDGKNKSDVFDITIPEYDFAMSWNLGNSQTWAIDAKSVNEIGCIHTAQGLEFDYVGVIIGNDLRYENGKVITDVTERAKTDQSIKGIQKMYQENPDKAEKLADEIIKNTYRTLLTRGQKGCYIYCEDKLLSEYLKRRVNRCNEIFYPIDNEEDKYTMMVAEEGEEYKYE